MTTLLDNSRRPCVSADRFGGRPMTRAFVNSLEWYDWNRATDQAGEAIVCKWESFRQ